MLASCEWQAAAAPDFREEPYWWDAASPRRRDDEQPDFGAKRDVVIVGGGITGVVAALKLARAGAAVLVLDRQHIGEGAARRNAGFIGRTLKRSVGWLEKHLGPGRGVRIYRELDDALKQIGALVREEGIDCHHRLCGRLIMANSAAHLRLLAEDLEDMRQMLGFSYELLGRSESAGEIASDRYAGGAVIPDLGSIHPGLYHEGLVERARSAGVLFAPDTEVRGFSTGEGLKTVETSKGAIQARHVVVATNGYTSTHLEWHARRVIPFRGYVIATELLGAGVVDKLLPGRRTYLDTKMNIDFIRPAPDSERILFGGMTGAAVPSASAIMPALQRRLVRILPDLAGVRISRAWLGQCAGTFDFMPHIGVHEGVHYALGYNFAGVPIGTSFGLKTAARILGQGDSHSEFDFKNFPTLPLYRGRPWFVPLAMKYFDWHDRRIAGPEAPALRL